jgi:hypothetical protein
MAINVFRKALLINTWNSMDETEKINALMNGDKSEKEFLDELCLLIGADDEEKKRFESGGIVAFCHYALNAHEIIKGADARAAFCCGCLLEYNGLCCNAEDGGILGINLKQEECEKLALQYYKKSAEHNYVLAQVAFEKLRKKLESKETNLAKQLTENLKETIQGISNVDSENNKSTKMKLKGDVGKSL